MTTFKTALPLRVFLAALLTSALFIISTMPSANAITVADTTATEFSDENTSTRAYYIDVIDTQTRFIPYSGYTMVISNTYKTISFPTSYEVSSLTQLSSWTGTYNGQSGTYVIYKYNYRIW